MDKPYRVDINKYGLILVKVEKEMLTPQEAEGLSKALLYAVMDSDFTAREFQQKHKD